VFFAAAACTALWISSVSMRMSSCSTFGSAGCLTARGEIVCIGLETARQARTEGAEVVLTGRAADAHGQYEKEIGYEDPDWPGWYAHTLSRG
jgi:hypothetical protein